jgi:hypothetical protein
MSETLPGTTDVTLPWIGSVRFEIYGAYCSSGHPMKSVKKRTLAITLLGNRFQITIGVRPDSIWRTPVCGKCLGIDHVITKAVEE